MGAGCKNDRGLAESVKKRQRATARVCCLRLITVLCRALGRESDASLDRDDAMKTILLALALFATGAHAAQDPDSTPCDGVDEDKQTLECSVYSRDTAVKLLDENFQNLMERVQTQFGANKAQADEFTGKLKVAQDAWKKLRDADCAVEVFPDKPGTKDYNISQNDCLARTSDERSEYLETIAQSD
jgi:uncharacterized protein YecT (DUF1311 family)